MGKRKTATALEASEALGDVVVQESPAAPAAEPQPSTMQESTLETPSVQQQKPDLLAEAPELFGVNWTSQQVEDFKQKEIIWRSKLRSM